MDGLGNSVDISLPLFGPPFLLMFNKSGADADDDDDDVADDDDDDNTRG
jgi:hypothetical protein